MTNPRAEYLGYRERSRDIDELLRRAVWGSQTYLPGAGSIMSVRGTDYLDEDMPVINFGYSFNLPADSNAEVITLAVNSDTNQKMALPTLPRDVQHQWGEGQGGIQHPLNPERRIEFNDEETWVKDGKYVLGNNREVSVEVAGGVVTISVNGDANIESSGDMTLSAQGNMTLSADNVDINSGSLQHNGTNVGDDHRHPGVESGPSTTGGPQ